MGEENGVNPFSKNENGGGGWSVTFSKNKIG